MRVFVEGGSVDKSGAVIATERCLFRLLLKDSSVRSATEHLYRNSMPIGRNNYIPTHLRVGVVKTRGWCARNRAVGGNG